MKLKTISPPFCIITEILISEKFPSQLFLGCIKCLCVDLLESHGSDELETLVVEMQSEIKVPDMRKFH